MKTNARLYLLLLLALVLALLTASKPVFAQSQTPCLDAFVTALYGESEPAMRTLWDCWDPALQAGTTVDKMIAANRAETTRAASVNYAGSAPAMYGGTYYFFSTIWPDGRSSWWVVSANLLGKITNIE